MRRALVVAVVGIGLACGGAEGPVDEAPVPVKPVENEANRPPYVEAISIVPAQPSADDALSLALRVLDPDRDPLEIEVTWYRNGAVHDRGTRQSIDPGEFSRDDSIWVEAVISDGSDEITVKTEPVTISNSAPRVNAIRITPPQPSAADMLEAEVEGEDADGDPVRWSYRWFVDGQELEDVAVARLAPGRVRRGSRVALEVSGNDGIEDGEWIASPEIIVANAPPKITTQPVYGLASPGRYVYAVKAEDPDADQPLRWDLADGPPGMSIDAASGVVTWSLPRDARGSYPVEIAVSDTHGARTLQRWSLDVSWETEDGDANASRPPAASAPSGSSTDEADAGAAEGDAADDEDPDETDGDEDF